MQGNLPANVLMSHVRLIRLSEFSRKVRSTIRSIILALEVFQLSAFEFGYFDSCVPIILLASNIDIPLFLKCLSVCLRWEVAIHQLYQNVGIFPF